MTRVLLIGFEDKSPITARLRGFLYRGNCDIDTLPDEIGVRYSKQHPCEYDFIVIMGPEIPTCLPTAHNKVLSIGTDWSGYDPRLSGMRILCEIRRALKGMEEPPPVFMGCHVPISPRDIDLREPIRALRGTPFYLDAPEANGERTTRDGTTLTVPGLIHELFQILSS